MSSYPFYDRIKDINVDQLLSAIEDIRSKGMERQKKLSAFKTEADADWTAPAKATFMNAINQIDVTSFAIFNRSLDILVRKANAINSYKQLVDTIEKNKEIISDLEAKKTTYNSLESIKAINTNISEIKTYISTYEDYLRQCQAEIEG